MLSSRIPSEMANSMSRMLAQKSNNTGKARTAVGDGPYNQPHATSSPLTPSRTLRIRPTASKQGATQGFRIKVIEHRVQINVSSLRFCPLTRKLKPQCLLVQAEDVFGPIPGCLGGSSAAPPVPSTACGSRRPRKVAKVR